MSLTSDNPIRGVGWLPVEVGLEMYAEKPVVLPFFTGYVSMGLLLRFFGRVDPVLAGALHEADRPKLYSVTHLRFKSESYEELCKGVSEPVESFRLYFQTPTYLASLGTDFRYLFPDYVRIFPSLMHARKKEEREVNVHNFAMTFKG